MNCSTTNNTRNNEVASTDQRGEAPDKVSLRVARLTDAQIAHLSRKDLVQLILSVDFAFVPPDFEQHLSFGDRQALEKLAHLARRCCRHQVTEDAQRLHPPGDLDEDLSEISSGVWRR